MGIFMQYRDGVVYECIQCISQSNIRVVHLAVEYWNLLLFTNLKDVDVLHVYNGFQSLVE